MPEYNHRTTGGSGNGEVRNLGPVRMGTAAAAAGQAAFNAHADATPGLRERVSKSHEKMVNNRQEGARAANKAMKTATPRTDYASNNAQHIARSADAASMQRKAESKGK